MTINMATTTSEIDYSKLKLTSSATTTTKSTAESTNDENKVNDTARRYNISEYSDSVEISDEGRKLQKEGMPEGPPSGGSPPTGGASTSATSTDEELSEEEKLYDADGDGTLSLEEEAAYLEAQANKKALEVVSKSNEALKDVSVNTNDEAEKMNEQTSNEQLLINKAITAYNNFK